MPKLSHTYAGSLVKDYPLSTGALLHIGRKPDNDICLDDLTVSGRHALISVRPSEYMENLNDVYLEDLDSTNGTQVNGRVVHRHLLKHGDVISIGTHEFTLIDENTMRFEQTMVYVPEDS